MGRANPILTLCTVAFTAMALPSSASATCARAQILRHALDGHFINCPDSNPVKGYAYVLGQEALVNTQRVGLPPMDIVCEGGTAETQQGLPCQVDAGSPGDGRVTIAFDWGGLGQTNGDACPNPDGVFGVGRNVVQVIANDGSQVLITIGYSVDFEGYALEMAHPGDGFSPIACSQENGLALVSNTPGTQANTVCIAQTAPSIWSDCDAGTGGAAHGNTCQGGTATTPSVAPGSLYTLNGACGATPNILRASWQPLPTTPGPGGSKCGIVNVPVAAGECSFIGGSSMIAGVESDALTGYLRIPWNVAAVDTIFITKAEILRGRLRVEFATESEAMLVGFDVYAGGNKLNAGFIPAQGTGSNDYSFEVGRGALRNERSITVEGIRSDGTSVRSDPVSVQ